MLGANEDFILFFLKGTGGKKNANWKLRNEFVVIEKLQLKKKKWSLALNKDVAL